MKKFIIVSYLLLLVALMPCEAIAYFHCTMNGVSTTYANIPVNVTLNKTTDKIELFNLDPTFKCHGETGFDYQDALRIAGPWGLILDPALTADGYVGYIEDPNGVEREFSQVSYVCIWPDNQCSVNWGNASGLSNAPVRLKVGIKRKTASSSNNALNLAVGTNLIVMIVEQRGMYTVGQPGHWGGNYWRFNFTLSNPIHIPAYTCNVTNADRTVTLEPVTSSALRTHGTGRYSSGTNFRYHLACEPQTAVDIKFDGTTMTNQTTVLRNTNSTTDAVGIQVMFNNVPVVIDQTIRAINNARANEVLDFNAHYYYNGNPLNAGNVRSVATLSFDYK